MTIAHGHKLVVPDTYTGTQVQCCIAIIVKYTQSFIHDLTSWTHTPTYGTRTQGPVPVPIPISMVSYPWLCHMSYPYPYPYPWSRTRTHIHDLEPIPVPIPMASYPYPWSVPILQVCDKIMITDTTGLYGKIFFRVHWKLSWDFQGELLQELYNRLPGSVELCRGVINHSAI